MRRLPFLLFAFFLIVACGKEISLPPLVQKQVEKLIIAAIGGTLNTADSIKLSIPSYALPADGKVFVGRTGDEPVTVPNGDLKVVGIPVTLKIPADTLYKPLQLSFPAAADMMSTDHYFIYLYNGSSYFPVTYSSAKGIVTVLIDIINWESTEKKAAKEIQENIINVLIVFKQTPPDAEMGLKEVSIENDMLHYAVPDAGASSRILLLVHGWTARPKVWLEFIQKIKNEANLSYTDIWTFGYNSSWGIRDNAELLAQSISSAANGAQIDIVAHSMGGLVSRSMIEQYGGAGYINKLIAVGSPHQGSPLAASRYFLGEIVSTSGKEEDYILYDHVSQGFNDLNTNSEFIREMDKLESPPLPYYTIAATNDPSLWKKVSGTILSGPDDGIVAVSSALGVRGATSPDLNVQIGVALAHMKMTKDDLIYAQVLNFLR